MVPLRLIERLDRAIGAAGDPLQREYLKAERAGAMARLGMLPEARFALCGLRTQNLRHKDALLSAWIHLVDGQIDHFGRLAPRCVDKFERALELAESVGHAPLQALASAWLANCAFNAANVPAMAYHVAAALSLAGPDQHAARARVGVVLADAYRCCDDDTTSQAWYLRARAHASADGDSTMVRVMLHNLSAVRSSQLALTDAFGHADLGLAEKALLEAESAASDDWGAGVASAAAMVPLIRAQLLVVLSRFEDAGRLFDEHIAQGRDEGIAHRGACFMADRAWCHLRMGHVDRALADARTAEDGVKIQRDADDRAAAYARLANVHRHAGRGADAARLQGAADLALCEYKAYQAQTRQMLNEALATLGPHET